MSPEARVRADRRVRETLAETRLQELRQRARGMTQTELAYLMDDVQRAISQIEERHDVLLSNLARSVHVLGGELELVARFRDADAGKRLAS